MKVKKPRLREVVTHPKSKSQRELELGPKSVNTKFDAFFKNNIWSHGLCKQRFLLVPGSLSISHYLLFTLCEWKSMVNDSLIQNKNSEGLKEEKKIKKRDIIRNNIKLSWQLSVARTAMFTKVVISPVWIFSTLNVAARVK